MARNSMDRSLLRFVYLLVSLASIVIIILGLRTAATLINAILLAALITIGILPVAQWLIKKGWKPSLAAMATLLVVAAVLAVVVLLTWYSIGRVSQALQMDLGDVVSTLPTTDEPAQIDSWLVQLQELYSDRQASQILEVAVGFVAPIVTQGITVLMILIFMLGTAVTTSISKQLEQFSTGENIERITRITRDVQQYISITTLINAATGLLNTIFLFVLGVDFALLWGILTWIFGYIPIIGFWIPLIPPVLLAWVEFGLPMAIVVFVGISIINIAAENFIKPRVMGDSLDVSPLVIFISLVVWGWVLGAAGAILAVPLTLLVASVLDSFEGTRWITALIRVTPAQEGDRDVAVKRLRGALGKAEDFWHGSE